MVFRKRYDEKYDPSKNYVVVDDDTLTEQAGYKTNTQLYEEFVRAGKINAAFNLGMSYEEYLDHEEDEPFELRYELDPVEQQEILNDYNIRLQEYVDRQSNQATQQKTDSANVLQPTSGQSDPSEPAKKD